MSFKNEELVLFFRDAHWQFFKTERLKKKILKMKNQNKKLIINKGLKTYLILNNTSQIVLFHYELRTTAIYKSVIN